MNRIAESYERFMQCGILTDSEVLTLMETFEVVRNNLAVLGPRFYIAFAEANTQYIDLSRIAKERGISV